MKKDKKIIRQDHTPEEAVEKEQPDRKQKEQTEGEQRDERERKIDEQIEQSFPASDPPSYAQPGNDRVKED